MPQPLSSMTKRRKPAARGPGMRRRRLRDELWPDASLVTFARDAGFAQVPRTIPLIASLIDHMGRRHRAGALYSVCWFRDFGDGLVETDPEVFVYEAGYGTRRAVRTWEERITILEELGFVRTRARGLKDRGWLLLVDPHPVVARLHEEDPTRFPDRWMEVFLHRCSEIGLSPGGRASEVDGGDGDDGDEDDADA